MTETLAFQRARTPEAISIRREAILAAAVALFDAEGPEGAGLNAIAARAGFTKSNVYRYFESREAVLITLFLDEFRAVVAAIETGLAEIAPGDTGAVAHLIAGAFLARPRLCRLMSILSSVLERNVSEEAVVALKIETLDLTRRIAGAMARVLPALSFEDCAWGGSVVAAFIAGLWPAAHPAPVVERVMARPEFAALKPAAERDLERMIFVVLKGLGA